MFRKLAELITPAPLKKAPAPEATPPAASLPDLSTLLKPLLKRLTAAPSLDDPKAQEALAEVKQLGLKRGLYVTAFEIRTQLDMLPRTDGDGVQYQKERGYVLAGDFFFAHISRELQGIRTKSQPIGPNIFKGYCDEMVECIIRSGSPKRCAEIPVLIIDELLASAVDIAQRSDIFLELAHQAVISVETIVTHYLDIQASDGSAKLAAGRAGTPTPLPRGVAGALDETMLAYIRDLHQKIREIRNKSAQLAAAGHAAATPPPKTPLELDQALLTIANSAQYLPFSGIVKERIAGILQPTQAAKAATFYRSAADSYENQGDLEVELRLTKLPARRYQKACELYLKAGDPDRAKRAQLKHDKFQAARRQQA